MKVFRNSALIVLCILFASVSSWAASSPEQWAVDNGLHLDEPMDALYAAALEREGGKVVVYTISSRTKRIATAFMKEYPGMNMEVYDIFSGTLKEKFLTEYAAGFRTADIVHSKEQVGEYTFEVFGEGLLHNYQPASIFGSTPKEYLTLTPLMLELNLWFYNTEVYEKCPVNSWWDFTKEEWRGKVVFQDAAANDAYCAMLTAMVQHADEMAADYEKVFGSPIVLDADEPTAAHAFIKRFLANDPIMAKGSDEVIEMVGAAGQTHPPVAILPR